MNIRKMTITALLMALTTVATLAIQIPMGAFGYFNLGDTIIYIAATIINPIGAMLVGGLGSALADVLGGWASYAPFTLVVKGLEGLIVGFIYRKTKNIYLAIVSGGILIPVGYYVSDYILQGPSAIQAVPGNTLQFIASGVLAIILIKVVKINKIFK